MTRKELPAEQQAMLEAMKQLIKFDYDALKRANKRFDEALAAYQAVPAQAAEEAPGALKAAMFLAASYSTRAAEAEDRLRRDIAMWRKACGAIGLDPEKAGLCPMYIAMFGKGAAND